MKSSKFTASKSLLERYFSGCAHQAHLYKRWNLKEVFLPKYMNFGIKVHNLIEDGLSGKALLDDDQEAVERAERALNWLEKSKYTILGIEERHFAPLTDDMQIFGIIDLIALDADGVPVLIDWKTSNAPWTTTKNALYETYYLNAIGWQGTIYLTRPYESNVLAPSSWPEKMQYVVIPKHGTVGVYDYWTSEESKQELIRACQTVKWATDNGNFPKNFSAYRCGDCNFRRVCHNMKNWEKYYNKREKK